MLLTVISPVYQAEKFLHILVSQIIDGAEKIGCTLELILVDDGSPDNSWEIIEELSKNDTRVKGVKLSRNFGQHFAVTAGLELAHGDAIVILDCDLQDNPHHFIELYKEYQKGYQIVFTKRINRKHSLFRFFTAFIYNTLFSFFSDSKYNIDHGTMVMLSKQVRNEIIKLKEKDRLYLQLLKWIGFKTSVIEIEHRERYSGKSSYSFKKLVSVAVQGWTSFSVKLLRLSIYTGFIFSFIAFFSIVYIIIEYFLHGFQPGWTSLFVLVLFSTGLILISIGIAGIYIGKIFEQSKNRPLYVIDRKINL